jgi:hypothetical protein
MIFERRLKKKDKTHFLHVHFSPFNSKTTYMTACHSLYSAFKNMKMESSATVDRKAEFLVIGAMPFLYGAATRLPFIYFVIHLDNHFHLDWWTIGLYVACYQGARVVTSAVSITSPQLSHFIGTSAGLAGYITVFVSDKDSVAPFVIGTAIVGFSETMSSMQKYAKEMYKLDPDRKKAQTMVKFQYAFVMIGVVFAFSIGGFVYQYHKINGVALFGIIIESLALLALFAFWCVGADSNAEDAITEDKVTFPIKNLHGEDEDLERTAAPRTAAPRTAAPRTAPAVKTEDASKVTFAGHEGFPTGDEEFPTGDEDAAAVKTGDAITKETSPVDEERQPLGSNKEPSKQKKNLRASMFTNGRFSVLLDAANADYSTCDLPATWVNWLLCASFGIEALTIGYNLSIGPIFLLNEFNQDVGIIGILFAAGAASGSVAAIGVTCTEFGNNLMRRIASSPFDLCFAMGGIAVGVLVAAVPNFAVHVIGLILLMCFNDLGATLMTELQASITTVSNYSLLGPAGQVVRRSLNVVTALTGPVLFGIYPRLPYFVAGGITLLWTIMLFIVFKLRTEHIVKAVSGKTGRNRKSVIKRMSFATTEVVHSMAAKH